jgi:hypothetical protein
MKSEVHMSAKKPATIPAIIDLNQRYSLAEAVALLRQSPAKTYNDIKAGTLRVIREGRRTYVPGSELVRRSRLPEQSAA